jgi:AcrR family transcriptional regulator
MEMRDGVKATRAYHSPLRADQARQTQERILDAAYGLFVERGYAGTPIVTVAERAGVSPETIYLSFGGKRGLLERVIQRAIAGGEPAEDGRARWTALAEQGTPRERLEQMVGFSCEILARTGPIHLVIRGAADKEAFAAELGSRLLHERLASQVERVRICLGEDLRSGLSADEAGQRYCALTSPELYHLLTVELGWTVEQHRQWLSELLAVELLG